ncbi:hypothetical protein JCM14469_35650 [Desulfatiferula olefinivorans]
MGHPSGGDGIGKGGGHVGLAHHLFKGLGSVFSCKNEICHATHFQGPAATHDGPFHETPGGRLQPFKEASVQFRQKNPDFT